MRVVVRVGDDLGVVEFKDRAKDLADEGDLLDKHVLERQIRLLELGLVLEELAVAVLVATESGERGERDDHAARDAE